MLFIFQYLLYHFNSIKKNKLKVQKNTVEKLLKDPNNLDDKYYYCTLNNNQCFLDYSTTEFNGEDNTPPNKLFNSDIPLYNCDGLKSTNPFCTKEFNENIPHELLADCVDPYFDSMLTVWETKGYEIAETTANLLFPSWVITSETLAKAEHWLSVTGKDASSALRRAITEGSDAMSRALKARAADK